MNPDLKGKRGGGKMGWGGKPTPYYGCHGKTRGRVVFLLTSGENGKSFAGKGSITDASAWKYALSLEE